MDQEKIYHNYIAGAIGGCTGYFVGYPLDTTKVQLQTHTGANQHRGIRDAVRSIYREGSIRGFYRGLSWPLATYGVVASLVFGVYGNSLKLLEPDPQKRTTATGKIFFAGCLGGAAQAFVIIPSDYVKVAMQAQISNTAGKGSTTTYFSSPLACARHILRTQGLKGMYKGTPVVLCRDIPSFGFYYVIFEKVSEAIRRNHWTDSRGLTADLIGGGCAGSLTWFAIMPFDVVKNRYQADFVKQYQSVWDCAVKSFRREGIKVFYRGCFVTCIRGFPVDAIACTVYSRIMRYLEGRDVNTGQVAMEYTMHL